MKIHYNKNGTIEIKLTINGKRFEATFLSENEFSNFIKTIVY